MEEITASLSTSVRVSLEDSDVSLMHPRYTLYKARNTNGSQEKRRTQWLENHRKKRQDLLNGKRGIVRNQRNHYNHNNNYNNNDRMDLDITSNRKHKKNWERESDDRCYKDWLMMSEWMVDVPERLPLEWICVLCPEGKRVLVVADKGNTCAYSRKGDFVMKFPSVLPGGCAAGPRGYTVVDCIWHHPTKTLYLLDVLIWGIPLINCEAELRFFWLNNKFSEIPGLKERTVRNRHPFILLKHKPVIRLPQMLGEHPAFTNNFPKVDGIIFYHKDSIYTGGKSPMVAWLKPFMVPDIVGIPVLEPYIAEKPLNYPERPIPHMEMEENNSSKEMQQ